MTKKNRARSGLKKDPDAKALAQYEDNLLETTELIHSETLPDHWERDFGTGDKKIAKHRHGRQNVVRDLIADQNHHELFFQCLNNIKNVDVDDPEGNPSLQIMKWKSAAELHLKALNKYVPDVKAVTLDVSDDTKAAAQGISRAVELIGAIAGRRVSGNDAGTVPSGSVVSTQVRDEEEGP